jgi:hypothetical protein
LADRANYIHLKESYIHHAVGLNHFPEVLTYGSRGSCWKPDVSRQKETADGFNHRAWAVGKWWCTFQGQNGRMFARGYWSTIYVRKGDTWKIGMSTFNQAPPPFAPTETK